ncbi:hypothetical protein [Bradyrhizobium phage ppBeUSDA76-2]|jgi:hypothetical protein|uniref:hypothetical protein n=1 Tax=Bradyrhizobium TaxID=374 RepID=UPI00037C6900|nr:hypothetical protein [Bradyrhizobium elkanii]WAX24436.1 hypothetical protein [Bradyrhizobium phage ppBeUSDA76-2]MCP1732404.1 hypothetical protein [Bradyrhizobium elkanii]MCP1932498.1 hypothetical protein [Bradyrhizobium elkanii]MCS3479575.1 hypothetical protein [Bradyrhizobium elkanii]MCS3567742.1 hypothetical protein [Bradyrhizobium elkanii]
MGEIIDHDFGKDDREHARRLAKLLRIVKETEQDLLANPGKYFDMASKKIAEQELLLRALSDAIRKSWMVKLDDPSLGPPTYQQPDMLRIDRRDYEAYQAIKEMLREWEQST